MSTANVIVWVGTGVVVFWFVVRAVSKNAADAERKAVVAKALAATRPPLPTPTQTVEAGSFYDITGPGTFDVHVVGTSHYQDALLSICGGQQTKNGKHKKVEAMLLREPTNPYDSNAVRVEISDKLVGYIPKGPALVFSHFVQNIPVICRFKVKALIVGGWKNDHDSGSFGVRLDM